MQDRTQTLGTAPLPAIAAASVALLPITGFEVHALRTLVLVALLTASARIA